MLSSDIQIRTLQGEQLKPLFEKLESMGQILPENVLEAWVVEDKGKIVGFALVHSLPIVEYVHAEYGYGHFLKDLFDRARDFVLGKSYKRVIAHTGHRAMKRMMERVGFIQSDFNWYEWRDGK